VKGSNASCWLFPASSCTAPALPLLLLPPL